MLEIALFSGDIEVEGYDGNEIIIVADAPVRGPTDEPEEPRADGLRRIQSSSVGLTVEEERQQGVAAHGFQPEERRPRSARAAAHVGARRTSSTAATSRCIGVTGEHELSNVNGDVIVDGHLGLGRR